MNISHLKNRFLRTPIESFEHKWEEEFHKYIFRDTGEFIDGKPIQRRELKTYRKCAKCECIEAEDWLGNWFSAPFRMDVVWRDNGLN